MSKGRPGMDGEIEAKLKEIGDRVDASSSYGYGISHYECDVKYLLKQVRDLQGQLNAAINYYDAKAVDYDALRQSAEEAVDALKGARRLMSVFIISTSPKEDIEDADKIDAALASLDSALNPSKGEESNG